MKVLARLPFSASFGNGKKDKGQWSGMINSCWGVFHSAAAAADGLTQDSSVVLLSSTLSRIDFSGEKTGIREVLDAHRMPETKFRLHQNYLEPKAIF